MFGEITFDGYMRRLDGWDYRKRRRDLPRDIDQLLSIVLEQEKSEEKSQDKAIP